MRNVAEAHVATGPSEPAGLYLRGFWQPVFHAVDLGSGRAIPLRIMGEDYTLYRAESGRTVMLDARCPHRGAQLSAGWIEGDALRCFYHGWKFGADGRCVDQPAEDSAFCDKVSVRSFPTREYLGLVFAFLGEGEPAPFPLFPEFERSAGFVEIDSYFRACNYFQNLENALDMSHVQFVHSDNEASFSGIGRGVDLVAEESSWGVRYQYTRPDGNARVQQFGMPNVFYMNALPTDPEIGWQESLFWWVPIDDARHVQFSLHRVPATGPAAASILRRRQARRSAIDIAHQDACNDVLSGRLALRDLDPQRVDLVRLQDDVAQIGQGRVADRSRERLGRGDAGVIAIRKLWQRELNAFRNGAPLKAWWRTPDLVPAAWSLGGARISANGGEANGTPQIVDVRPYVEVEVQLRELRRTGAMAQDV